MASASTSAKTDAAQIDSEHRCGGAARQLRRPQKGTVATQDQHQFTAGRRVLIGVDDFDIDTQGTELGRIQVHRPAIDGLGRQHPQRYTVLPNVLATRRAVSVTSSRPVCATSRILRSFTEVP